LTAEDIGANLRATRGYALIATAGGTGGGGGGGGGDRRVIH